MKLLNSALNTFRNANASQSVNALEIKCLVPAVSWDDRQEVTCLEPTPGQPGTTQVFPAVWKSRWNLHLFSSSLKN